MEDVDRAGRERPDGVNKKRLADLDLEPKIAIYHKVSANAANTLLSASFPREAFILFSKAAFESSRKARDNDVKFEVYQVRGGDHASLKMILEWAQDCVDHQSITKFQDIPEPDNDPFSPTLKVIDAANALDIPAGSLQFFLEKRLDFIARKHLMPFSQVREFYSAEEDPNQANLKRIACASIFNAWWNYRLDATVNPSTMEELFDLRKEIPELDEDLHQACKDKEEEVKQKKLAKKNRAAGDNYNSQRNGENHDFHQGGDFSNNATYSSATGNNGAEWNNPDTVSTTDATAEWDAPVMSNGRNKENFGNANGSASGPDQANNGQNNNNSFNWADEAEAEAEASNSRDQVNGTQPAFASAPNVSW